MKTQNDTVTGEKTVRELVSAGIEADRSGNHRLAATKYLQAFQVYPDRWDCRRWMAFSSYTFFLKDKDFPVNLEDEIASLKAIMEDKKELKLYRIEAAWNAGILFNDRAMRLEESADCFREAVRLATKVSKQEKRHKVRVVSSGPGVPRTKCMDELISPIVDECKKNLEHLNGNVWGEYNSLEEAMRAKGSINGSEPIVMNMFLGTSVTLAEFERLRTVGGERCDYCNKSREELDKKLLDVCGRCNKAYYCSRECQMKQWKAGHKQCCRKPGEFRPGDILSLFGVQSRPELTGTMAKVVGEDPRTKGYWKVEVLSGAQTISVPSEKMKHLRPLK